MKLNQLLDVELLQKHLDEKTINFQAHPTLPLGIYSYTHSVKIEQWGDGVLDYCRGLIVDPSGEIVARPFKKFHNLNTNYAPESMEDNLYQLGMKPEITEKMDGSLGIFWSYQGEWGIATRGSFTSDQAKWATQWYKNRVDAGLARPFSGNVFTPLFEIIYPENQIVVDYKGFEGLVLIGAVNKDSGQEANHEHLKGLGDIAGFAGSLIVLSHQPDVLRKTKAKEEENREGFVLTFHREDDEPVKVKMKFDDYVKYHKIVTELSPNKIWCMLSSGERVDHFDAMPKHFRIWSQRWIDKLYYDYTNMYCRAEAIFNCRPEFAGQKQRDYRKLCAEAFQQATAGQRELLPVLFAMLDRVTPSIWESITGRPDRKVEAAVWNLIEPAGNDQTFRRDGE